MSNSNNIQETFKSIFINCSNNMKDMICPTKNIDNRYW